MPFCRIFTFVNLFFCVLVYARVCMCEWLCMLLYMCCIITVGALIFIASCVWPLPRTRLNFYFIWSVKLYLIFLLKYKRAIYSALKKFLNKMKTFLINHKTYVGLKLPFQTIWIKIRPHETWGLIFDPYCLITSILFCWNCLFYIELLEFWGSRFCQCYKLSKNFRRALYI